ncbi:MAG: hypothetical protein ACI4MR_06275, partial [Candidatus Aphodomorpha sp.]
DPSAETGRTGLLRGTGEGTPLPLRLCGNRSLPAARFTRKTALLGTNAAFAAFLYFLRFSPIKNFSLLPLRAVQKGRGLLKIHYLVLRRENEHKMYRSCGNPY